MVCFICKRDLADASIRSVTSLSHGGDTVYVHTNHVGVSEEYSRQNSGQKLLVESPVNSR